MCTGYELDRLHCFRYHSILTYVRFYSTQGTPTAQIATRQSKGSGTGAIAGQALLSLAL